MVKAISHTVSCGDIPIAPPVPDGIDIKGRLPRKPVTEC